MLHNLYSTEQTDNYKDWHCFDLKGQIRIHFLSDIDSILVLELSLMTAFLKVHFYANQTITGGEIKWDLDTEIPKA